LTNKSNITKNKTKDRQTKDSHILLIRFKVQSCIVVPALLSRSQKNGIVTIDQKMTSFRQSENIIALQG